MQRRLFQQQFWARNVALFRLWQPPLPPEAQHLYTSFYERLVAIATLVMVLTQLLTDSVASLWLCLAVMVEGTYPLLVLVLHLCKLVVVLTLAVSLRRGLNVRLVLHLILGFSIIWMLTFIWLTNIVGAFVTLAAMLAFPAIILSVRTLTGITTAASASFVGLAVASPTLREQEWLAAMVVTIVLLLSLMIIGVSARQALHRFALIVFRREQAIAEQARVAERSKVLEDQHRRLLAAQHDLRAPCATAMRMAQLIQDPALDPAVAHSFVVRLEPLLLKLRTRIDALMDEAKGAQLHEARLPVVNLAATIRAYIPELQRWASLSIAGDATKTAPEITFHATGMCGIRAREGEIQRMIENLVLNSTTAGATCITISVDQHAGDSVVVIVQDNGGGFPPAFIKEPFQPKYVRRTHGVGLGLSGVAANVAAFGGTIHLDNWEHGAQVALHFPKPRR